MTFLNRPEDALARANWPKPGSMEARLELRIWLKVSLFFMMFPFGRPPGFLLLFSSLHRAVRRYCVVFLVLRSSVVFLLIADFSNF